MPAIAALPIDPAPAGGQAAAPKAQAGGTGGESFSNVLSRTREGKGESVRTAPPGTARPDQSGASDPQPEGTIAVKEWENSGDPAGTESTGNDNAGAAVVAPFAHTINADVQAAPPATESDVLSSAREPGGQAILRMLESLTSDRTATVSGQAQAAPGVGTSRQSDAQAPPLSGVTIATTAPLAAEPRANGPLTAPVPGAVEITVTTAAAQGADFLGASEMAEAGMQDTAKAPAISFFNGPAAEQAASNTTFPAGDQSRIIAGQPLNEADRGAIPPILNIAPENTSQLVVNSQGQVISIQSVAEGDQDAPIGGTGKTVGPGSESRNLDINANYLQSNLHPRNPSDPTTGQAPDQDQGSSSGSQREPAQTGRFELAAGSDQAPGSSATDQLPGLKWTAGSGSEGPPLIFAHQQLSADVLTQSTLPQSASLRLPSGMTVYDTTVVDQMINHFSVNRQFESGTVNLRLYPQELGELRMEIKVEQDNIKAHIIAQNPQAQEMIDRHLPRLREALLQQGLNLQQVEVTVAASDRSGEEAFRDNRGWQQADRSLRNTGSRPLFSLEGSEPILSVPTSTTPNLSVVA